MLKIRNSGGLSGDMKTVTLKSASGSTSIKNVYVKKSDGSTTKVWPEILRAEQTPTWDFGCGANPSQTRYNTANGAIQLTATNSDTKILATVTNAKRSQSAQAIMIKNGTTSDHWFPLCCGMDCSENNYIGLRVFGTNLELYTCDNGSFDRKRTWSAPVVNDTIKLVTQWNADKYNNTASVNTWVYKNGTLIGDDKWGWFQSGTSKWGRPGTHIRNVSSGHLNKDLWKNFVFNSWTP